MPTITAYSYTRRIVHTTPRKTNFTYAAIHQNAAFRFRMGDRLERLDLRGCFFAIATYDSCRQRHPIAVARTQAVIMRVEMEEAAFYNRLIL
eukprot:scaffold517_cov119-Cylindrotheca_fusiformis.AAC.18